MRKPPIIFIHGLWLHPTSWHKWEKYYKKHGYKTMAPPWPGDCKSVAEAREYPEHVSGFSLQQVCDQYAGVITRLDQTNLPILIGHSFGGLIAQEILGRGLASAAVAIDPAPIKGVWQLPLSALKASLPVLKNPANQGKSIMLTYEQFRYAFANAVSEEEARALYEEYAIPAPAKPLFQVAVSTFNPQAENKVNTKRERGPLLITGGSADNTAPPVWGKKTLGKYPSDSITEYVEFEDRGHSLVIDSGWEEIAEFTRGWLEGALDLAE